MTEAERWKATVFVGGLSNVVRNSHVVDAFLPFGEIVAVKLPRDEAPNSTEPHRGFAYVEYEDVADAKEAIDNMDQAELFGRILKVSQAKAPKSADEGLGSKTAVWAQENWIAEHAAEGGPNLDGSQEKAMVETALDPMQGLEGLDVAGPKPL